MPETMKTSKIISIYIFSCRLHHYTTLYSYYGNKSKHHILCHVTFQDAPIWTCTLLCKIVMFISVM